MTPKKAALFMRVSSKEQKDEGFSLEAQDRASAEYSVRHGLEVVRTWSVAETASKTELRRAFKEFVQFVRTTPTVSVMVFEKPDRMTRNFSDLVTIYDLIQKHGKELQFFRTGLKIDQNMKSSEQLQLDLQVVVARNYVNNLREEVIKGMTEKWRRGGFPAMAPLGYLNNREKAEIEVDPARAPLVTRLFKLYATGRYTLRALAEKASEMGLQYGDNPNPVTVCTLYRMLQNPIYVGIVRWRGEEVTGTHEAIIARPLFDRVQEVLGRENRPRNLRFAFRGLAVCGGCGSTVTAEQHKKRLKEGTQRVYVYYHCTGWKNSGSICAYIREEDLMAQLAEPLKNLHMPASYAREIQRELRSQLEEEWRTAKDRRVTLAQEGSRLKNRLDQAYNDKLDGLLTADEYREKSAAWRARLDAIQTELRQLNEGGAESLLVEVGRILDVARRAHDVFLRQPDPFERRKMIDLFVSKVVINGERVLSNLREPFQTLTQLARMAG